MTEFKDSPRTKEMVPYDFRAPFVRVTLITEELEFPLWQSDSFGDANISGERVSFEGKNLAVLQEVLIEWQGMFYSMTINLSPNYEDAIHLVDSYLLQQGQTLVRVEMGFRTTGRAGPSIQTFNGVIEGIDFTVGTEISLVLKTVPPPTLTMGAAASDQNNDQEPWNNRSALEIIQELWEGQGDDLVKYYTSVTPEGTDPSIQLLQKKIKTYARGGKNNWGIIKDLAEANGCVVLVDGMTLHIDSVKNSVGNARPLAQFHLFAPGVLGDYWNFYPITSVSLKTSDLFARTMTGLVITGVDEKTGEAVKKTAGTAESDDTGADIGAQTKGADDKKPGGGPTPETSTVPKGGARTAIAQHPNEKKDRTKPLSEQIADWKSAGIQLEIESLLIPHLVPHELIDVTGMGSRIDGRYWIEKLFFQVGPDGGLTRFDCVRTGLRSGPDQLRPFAGTVNTSPAPEPGDSSEKPAESEDG